MIATIEGRKSLDIPTTLEEYSNTAGNTLSDYILSGCDTASVLCRIGILTSPKMLKLDNCRAGIYLYKTDILLHSITCSLLYGHSAKWYDNGVLQRMDRQDGKL